MADRAPDAAATGLLQAFVNTRNMQAGRDQLARPEDVRRWLAEHGLLDASERVSDDELATVLGFREALRSLMAANNRIPADDAARATVNEAAELARLAPRLDAAGRPVLECRAGGVAGALGELAALTFATMLDGSFRRLKACRAPDCRWIFYDR